MTGERVKLVRHFRFGPDGDEKDSEILFGTVLHESAELVTVQDQYGELHTLPKELREGGPGSRIVRHGWVRQVAA